MRYLQNYSPNLFSNEDDEQIRRVMQAEESMRKEMWTTSLISEQEEYVEDLNTYLGAYSSSFQTPEVYKDERKYLQQQYEAPEKRLAGFDLDPSLDEDEYTEAVLNGMVPYLMPDEDNGGYVRSFMDPTEISWLQTWGGGESNRSILTTNAQANYIRSGLYFNSLFDKATAQNEEVRDLFPLMEDTPKLEPYYQEWRESETNIDRLLFNTFDLENIPLLGQFATTPDGFMSSYTDPSFKPNEAIKILRKYEPELWANLTDTNIDQSKLLSSQSAKHFQYHVNEHVMNYGLMRGWEYFKENATTSEILWHGYIRPFAVNTFNDADMPVELAATIATFGVGGAAIAGYKVAKGVRRANKVTDARRILAMRQEAAAVSRVNKIRNGILTAIPSNWPALLAHKGYAKWFAAPLGSRKKAIVATSLAQGFVEGIAYYQINHLANIGTEAQFDWTVGGLLTEAGTEAIGQVVIGPVFSIITGGLGKLSNKTFGTATELAVEFTPFGNILSPQELDQLMLPIKLGMSDGFNNLTSAQQEQFLKAQLLHIQTKNDWKRITGNIDMSQDGVFLPTLLQQLSGLSGDVRTPVLIAEGINRLANEVSELKPKDPNLSTSGFWNERIMGADLNEFQASVLVMDFVTKHLDADASLDSQLTAKDFMTQMMNIEVLERISKKYNFSIAETKDFILAAGEEGGIGVEELKSFQDAVTKDYDQAIEYLPEMRQYGMDSEELDIHLGWNRENMHEIVELLGLTSSDELDIPGLSQILEDAVEAREKQQQVVEQAATPPPIQNQKDQTPQEPIKKGNDQDGGDTVTGGGASQKTVPDPEPPTPKELSVELFPGATIDPNTGKITSSKQPPPLTPETIAEELDNTLKNQETIEQFEDFFTSDNVELKTLLEMTRKPLSPSEEIALYKQIAKQYPEVAELLARTRDC